jgi:hypothetical protein
MKKNTVKIYFNNPVNGLELHNISTMFSNRYKQGLCYSSIKMVDTAHKEIMIMQTLTACELSYLEGLITGYLRSIPVFETYNQYGERIA